MMAAEIICAAKHTVFQPADDQWRCPGCGATNEHFYIDESAENSNEECGKLHEKDYVVCRKCDYGASGKALAKSMQEKYHYKTCPTCGGKGTVPA
jgi:Zn finger protein HypA/HybF involved in hydrogenase expression